nr:hypothetical protein StreXyl84_73300 [Streptomyces sp. Xyl84]
MGLTMAYGPTDEEAGVAALRRAHELGVTFFDTAEMYGRGTGSNEILRAGPGRGTTAPTGTARPGSHPLVRPGRAAQEAAPVRRIGYVSAGAARLTGDAAGRPPARRWHRPWRWCCWTGSTG